MANHELTLIRTAHNDDYDELKATCHPTFISIKDRLDGGVNNRKLPAASCAYIHAWRYKKKKQQQKKKCLTKPENIGTRDFSVQEN